MSGRRPLRCLLIAPLTFYSFHLPLVAALERRGYVVDVLNEEFPANAFGKLMGKISLPLLRRMTLAGLRRRLAGGPRYDLVLIVKGRGLGRASLSFLRTLSNRIVGYNFDSFRFNPSPRDWLDLTDRYATFDIADAERFGLPLVHLFSAVSESPVERRDVDLSIIMRVHSDRLSYVDRVVRGLPGKRLTIFLFASSRLIFLLHALRAPVSAWRLRHHMAFKPLTYVDAMKFIARSYATLDYAHPLQSGITVRCYEAQSLGVAIVTNNPYVADAGVFPSGSVDNFPLDGDPLLLPAMLERLSSGRGAPTVRGIDSFISDVLGNETKGT